MLEKTAKGNFFQLKRKTDQTRGERGKQAGEGGDEGDEVRLWSLFLTGSARCPGRPRLWEQGTFPSAPKGDWSRSPHPG